MRIAFVWPLQLFFCALLLLQICPAATPPAPFEVQTNLPRAAIFPAGTEIPFTLLLRFPDTYSFQGFSVMAYLFNLPGNFAETLGKTVNTKYGAKWASVALEPMLWLPAEQRKLNKQQGSLSTKGWPPGDYSITVSCFFQGSDKKEKLPDKYVVGNLIFSLE